MYLETKPDYDKCVERVQAWFDAEIIDRAPIRFHRHNAEYDNIIGNSGHSSLRDRWMDAGFQASCFDCTAAWRGTENICMDMKLDEQMVTRLMQLASEHFLDVYDEFDALLKAHGQPSVTYKSITT